MGFANPWALGLAATYIVLIALHLWERRHHVHEVPSLLFWETIPPETQKPARFRPDGAFWLQAIVLAGLIGGLAKPFLSGRSSVHLGRRHVFVLDVSASMGAREGGSSRFDAALAALRNRLRSLDVADVGFVITAGSRPTVIADEARNRDAIAESLTRVSAEDTSGDLAVSLSLARTLARRGEHGAAAIEAFTDVAPTSLSAEARDGIRFYQFGSSDDNVAIEGVEVLQGRFQRASEATVHVTVRNYAHKSRHGLLRARLNDQPLESQGFSMSAREARVFTIRGLSGSGVLHTHLDVDDALVADNDGWAWIAPDRKMRVIVVSRPHPLLGELRQLQRALPQLSFELVPEEEYQESTTAGADLVLFREFAPSRFPPRPTLFVSPPPHDRLIGSVGQINAVDVLDWNDDHPVLRDLAGWTPPAATDSTLFEPPNWAEPLLFTRSEGGVHVLAWAGEREGARIAALGLDLDEQGLLGSDQMGTLTLFLRLVEWLSPESPSTAILRTGEVFPPLDLPPLPAELTTPDGKRTTHDLHTPFEPTRVGLHHFQVGDRQLDVYANLFSPSESDIGRRSDATIVANTPETQPTEHGPTFEHWLYLAAALMLVIEWWWGRRTDGAAV